MRKHILPHVHNEAWKGEQSFITCTASTPSHGKILKWTEVEDATVLGVTNAHGMHENAIESGIERSRIGKLRYPSWELVSCGRRAIARSGSQGQRQPTWQNRVKAIPRWLSHHLLADQTFSRSARIECYRVRVRSIGLLTCELVHHFGVVDAATLPGHSFACFGNSGRL